MANLQKVIKVTQSQYDTLASGGTVGSYTGLNDNYIYLIEDTNEYLTSAGGNIAYGSSGIMAIDDNEDAIAGFCVDYFGNEIIYNNADSYRHLFASDSDLFIYSENSNYLDDFTFSTNILKIEDAGDTGAWMSFEAETAGIAHNAGGTTYYATLPAKTGTIALTSDIPSISLTTTAGSESISDGTNTLNVATRDTVQTFSANKTFTSSAIFQYTGRSDYMRMYAPSWGGLRIDTNSGFTVFQVYRSNVECYFGPGSDNSTDIGNFNGYWRNMFIKGVVNPNGVIGNPGYGIVFPSTAGWTANKTLALVEDIPTIKWEYYSGSTYGECYYLNSPDDDYNMAIGDSGFTVDIGDMSQSSALFRVNASGIYYDGNNNNNPTSLIMTQAQFDNATGGGAATATVNPIVDLVYPIGAIYMSTTDSTVTAVQARFVGTTWVKIEDKFLLADGNYYDAGDTGGESSHTLTPQEMPAHNHELLATKNSGYSIKSVALSTSWGGTSESIDYRATGGSTYGTGIQLSGGGQAHNNMPPYYVVYMYRRTA